MREGGKKKKDEGGREGSGRRMRREGGKKSRERIDKRDDWRRRRESARGRARGSGDSNILSQLYVSGVRPNNVARLDLKSC